MSDIPEFFAEYLDNLTKNNPTQASELLDYIDSNSCTVIVDDMQSHLPTDDTGE